MLGFEEALFHTFWNSVFFQVCDNSWSLPCSIRPMPMLTQLRESFSCHVRRNSSQLVEDELDSWPCAIPRINDKKKFSNANRQYLFIFFLYRKVKMSCRKFKSALWWAVLLKSSIWHFYVMPSKIGSVKISMLSF